MYCRYSYFGPLDILKESIQIDVIDMEPVPVAGPSVAHLHNRMPVILSPQFYETWLGSNKKDTDKLKRILREGLKV